MISPKLKSVILSALELDDFPLLDSTMAPEVPGWDSLNHVKVIAAVEEAFGVHFKSRQILALKTVGDLQRLVDSLRPESPVKAS